VSIGPEEFFSSGPATDPRDFKDRLVAVRNLSYPDHTRNIDEPNYASIAQVYKGHPERILQKSKIAVFCRLPRPIGQGLRTAMAGLFYWAAVLLDKPDFTGQDHNRRPAAQRLPQA
jgi:hypothetical protein